MLGPMVKLGWGVGHREATLGVIIQFPALKIALLGRLQVMLRPSRRRRSSCCGSTSPASSTCPAKTLSFDGSLDGSRIAIFTLTGDIAMRADFGDQPDFACRPAGCTLSTTPPGPSRCCGDSRSRSPRRQPAPAPRGVLRAHARDAAVRRARRALLRRRHRGRREARDRRRGRPRRADHVPVDVRRRLDIHVLLRRNGEPFMGVELDLRLAGAEPLEIDGKATLHFLRGAHDPVPQDVRRRAVDAGARPGRPARQVRERWATTAAGRPAARRRDRRAAARGRRRRRAAARTPARALAVHQTVAPLGVTLEKAGEAPIAGRATRAHGAHGRRRAADATTCRRQGALRRQPVLPPD